jgi:chromosomal replication initiation ATPase DnaA
MDEKKHLEHLLKNIQHGLSEYSAKELNEAFIEAIDNKGEKNKDATFVLNMVAEHYNMSVRTLKKASARGVQQDAKQVCYCLLHLDLGLTFRQISKRIFFNWPSSVVTGVRRLRNIKTSTVNNDKAFLQSYTELRQKLIEHLKLKTTHNGN